MSPYRPTRQIQRRRYVQEDNNTLEYKLKFEFPYKELPVTIPSKVLDSLEVRKFEHIVNGRRYKISKNERNIVIKYKINDFIDFFFMAFLQVTESVLSLESNTNNQHYWRIHINPTYKFLWVASIVVFLIVSIGVGLEEPSFGLIFFLAVFLIAFLQFKIFSLAVKYICNRISNDIPSLIDYCERML